MSYVLFVCRRVNQHILTRERCKQRYIFFWWYQTCYFIFANSLTANLQFCSISCVCAFIQTVELRQVVQRQSDLILSSIFFFQLKSIASQENTCKDLYFTRSLCFHLKFLYCPFLSVCLSVCRYVCLSVRPSVCVIRKRSYYIDKLI